MLCFIADQAEPDTSNIVTLVASTDPLFLQTNTTSNPVSTFEFKFNGSLVMPNLVFSSSFTNDTPSFGGFTQSAIISSPTTGSDMAGYYIIETCNVVGCKTDEYTIIIHCMQNFCLVIMFL